MSNTPITDAAMQMNPEMGDAGLAYSLMGTARMLEKENQKLRENLTEMHQLANELFPLAIVYMASYNRSSDEKTWTPVHREIYERAIDLLGE